MAKYNIKWDMNDEGDWSNDIEWFLQNLRLGMQTKYLWYSIWTKEGSFISKKKVCLYIGKADKQTTTERLLNKHKALFEIIKDGVFPVDIAFAYSEDRMKKDSISDIERALIYELKPRYNAQSVSNYKGPSIRIISEEGKGRFIDSAFDFTVEL